MTWLKTKLRNVLLWIVLFYFTLLLSMLIFGGARKQLLPAPFCLLSHSTEAPGSLSARHRPPRTSASNILLWKVTFNTKNVLTTSTWLGLMDWFWSWLSFEWHLSIVIHGTFLPICSFKHQNQTRLSSHQSIYVSRMKKTWNSAEWKLSGWPATFTFSMSVYLKFLHKQITIIFPVG